MTIERHIGKCPKCNDMFLYDFKFEKEDNTVIELISVPCQECARELEWDFLPKRDIKLVQIRRVG